VSSILYIVRQKLDGDSSVLLSGGIPGHHDARILLIQSGGTLADLPAVPTYALSDDLRKHEDSSRHRQISSSEMVQILFRAERVIVL
jgi:hypothetical protein